MLRWKACGSVRFSVDEVKAFAERHGWELLDAVDVDVAAREAETMRERCAPGCDGTYPRFMKVPSIVMRFDSGWTREDPGTNEMSTAFGYAQVARDGSSMYVFHFWGNG
jgi:hypothetical protein